MSDIQTHIGRILSGGGGGTTLSAGAAKVFESASTDYVSVTMMDSTHAIVAYQDYGNSSYGTACCLSLS